MSVIDRALLALARRNTDNVALLVPPLLESDQSDEFLGLVQAHRLQGLLASDLESLGIDSGEVGAWLAALHDQRVATQLGAVGTLHAWGRTLSTIDCPYVALKGPILSETVYPDPVLRPYGDLDVLVPRRRFLSAVAALEDAGAAVLEQNWDLLVSEARSQLHLEAPTGTTDLHWHLLNRGSVRRGFAVPIEEVLERRRTVAVGGAEVAALDPVDQLLHLCLHAALSGGRRLLWSVDIAFAIATTDLDWDQLAARARSWRASRVVAWSLARAFRDADAPVDPAVIEGLTGARWLGFASWLDSRWPAARSDGRLDPAGFAGMVIRDRGRDIVVALGSRARQRVTTRPSAYEPAGERAGYESWVGSPS